MPLYVNGFFYNGTGCIRLYPPDTGGNKTSVSASSSRFSFVARRPLMSDTWKSFGIDSNLKTSPRVAPGLSVNTKLVSFPGAYAFKAPYSFTWIRMLYCTVKQVQAGRAHLLLGCHFPSSPEPGNIHPASHPDGRRDLWPGPWVLVLRLIASVDCHLFL